VKLIFTSLEIQTLLHNNK